MPAASWTAANGMIALDISGPPLTIGTATERSSGWWRPTTKRRVGAGSDTAAPAVGGTRTLALRAEEALSLATVIIQF